MMPNAEKKPMLLLLVLTAFVAIEICLADVPVIMRAAAFGAIITFVAICLVAWAMTRAR